MAVRYGMGVSLPQGIEMIEPERQGAAVGFWNPLQRQENAVPQGTVLLLRIDVVVGLDLLARLRKDRCRTERQQRIAILAVLEPLYTVTFASWSRPTPAGQR